MSAMVIDFDDIRIRNAAKAMAPARLRIGGSEGDVVCYDVPEFNSTCDSMGQNDTAFCLSTKRFDEISKFASDMNLELVFGLNAVWGRQGQNLSNPLDLTNIRALLSHASKNNVPLWGVELGTYSAHPIPTLYLSLSHTHTHTQRTHQVMRNADHPQKCLHKIIVTFSLCSKSSGVMSPNVQS